jgi:phage-related protein
MYLNGKLGEPNSIENARRYIDAQVQLKKIKHSKQALKLEIPATFDSLTSLEDFIYETTINNYKQIMEEADQVNVDVVLDTPNVTIYHPKTETGAKYYGKHTKWCTAATNDNRFLLYNKKGPLYIIIPKSSPQNKFEIQFESVELRDKQNKPVDSQYLSELLKDKEFDHWFNNKVANNITDGHLLINSWLPFFKEEYISIIKKITLVNLPSGPIFNFLNKLSNLQELNFGDKFNQPLANSLDNMTSLRVLTFGQDFNQTLANSLDRLVNLQKLNFGRFFNNGDQPLGNALDKLTNLHELNFDMWFNNGKQPFGNSFNNLVNLQKLNIGQYFNKPLGSSLDGLINLQQLIFGEFFNNGDQSLGSSLDGLINLQELIFGKFFNNGNQPLGSSLNNLIKLQKLTFCYKFNQPLANSLDNLTNLQQLTFGEEFDQPLGSSLNNLTKLQQLTFSGYFNNGNQPLGSSLDNLINLEKLKLGNIFKQPVMDSVDKLVNLQQLTLPIYYKHPLPQKPNLKIIKF